jgi:hypothetical protein
MSKRRIRVGREGRRRRIQEPRRAAKKGSAWVDGAKQQIGKCVMNEWRDPGAVVAIAGRGPFPLEDEAVVREITYNWYYLI